MSKQSILPFLEVFILEKYGTKVNRDTHKILFASHIIATKWNSLLTAKICIDFIVMKENHRLLLLQKKEGLWASWVFENW